MTKVYELKKKQFEKLKKDLEDFAIEGKRITKDHSLDDLTKGEEKELLKILGEIEILFRYVG